MKAAENLAQDENESNANPQPRSSSNSKHSQVGQKYIGFLMSQIKLMKQVIEQNSIINSKFLDIRNEIERLQQSNAPSESVQGPVPTKKNILELICPEVESYDYSLSLVDKIPSPVCKGKYFSFNVSLKNEGILKIPIEERIQIKVSIYSAENPPKVIKKNMSGEIMIKGHTTSTLTYDSKLGTHSASFKIQLNEVTSHFMNGWVFLVVETQTPCEFLETLGIYIKPLIIKKLIIKAKETTCKRWREKEQEMREIASEENLESGNSAES
ncbi:unnamed protein product [Blepharisma stoltei]|uniref:Uncharacterized protein n=1 Tax=Blepharisma stoltei TaxID=1481888 RepID=A0AAU9JNX9_9CILI|nr:unnamed protein product [Blepharisma stoltei]